MENSDINNSVVGTLMGTGLARETGAIGWKAIRNIVKGWVIASISGITIAFLPARFIEIWFRL